jgi:hypothetical protein
MNVYSIVGNDRNVSSAIIDTHSIATVLAEAAAAPRSTFGERRWPLSWAEGDECFDKLSNSERVEEPPQSRVPSAASDSGETSNLLWYNLYILTLNAVSENQANRYRLQKKVWVLGTRTPALGGNVRLKELRSSGGCCQ